MKGIILAAGKSKRINLEIPPQKKTEYYQWITKITKIDLPIPADSYFPKVLLPLNDRPMVFHIIEEIRRIGIEKIIVVINPNYNLIKECIACGFSEQIPNNLEFAYQKEPKGTADALYSCAHLLSDEDILVVCGDTPLLKHHTIQKLLAHHKSENPDITLLTAYLADPSGYGRIRRDGDNLSIVEERDASEAEKMIKEVNAGVYLFKWWKIFPLFPRLEPSEETGELYLTSLVEVLIKMGGKVKTVTTEDSQEILGVNRWEEYLKIKNLFEKRS